MQEKQEIILKDDGTCVHRRVQEAPCNVVDKLVQQLSSSAPRLLKNFTLIDDQPVHIVLEKTDVLLGMNLRQLPLHLNWVAKEGKLHPNPIEQGDTPSGNLMRVFWEPVNGLRLMYFAKVSSSFLIDDQKSFLLAFDNSNNNWRLPLPNVYEDCSLCMGTYDRHGDSFLDAFTRSWEQFKTSNWSTHLISGKGNQNMARLFEMAVDKSSGQDEFRAVFSGNWTSLCWTCENRWTAMGRLML
jgi:hypothetical protein